MTPRLQGKNFGKARSFDDTPPGQTHLQGTRVPTRVPSKSQLDMRSRIPPVAPTASYWQHALLSSSCLQKSQGCESNLEPGGLVSVVTCRFAVR
eukprot:478466-Rhodomonas_salina.2